MFLITQSGVPFRGMLVVSVVVFIVTLIPQMLGATRLAFRLPMITARIVLLAWLILGSAATHLTLFVCVAVTTIMTLVEQYMVQTKSQRMTVPQAETAAEEGPIYLEDQVIFDNQPTAAEPAVKARPFRSLKEVEEARENATAISVAEEMRSLRRLLKEEQERANPAPRSAARVQLLERALANREASLAELETQATNRAISKWLRSMESALVRVRGNLSTENATLEELNQTLREISLLEESGGKLLQPGSTQPAMRSLSQALTQLTEVRENIHDRRVLAAVGDSALPQPAFLRPEKPWDVEQDWDKDWADGPVGDFGEGEYHEIKGQLRVIDDSDRREWD